MENFIVSARKYRPQTFNTVVGQSHITTTLKNAINSQQLAHAFLFCGPRGVGKTTCARILAKTINCENLTADGEACDACTSCRTFNAGTSLNIHELDAASNNSVDDIRTLTEQVRFAPQAGKYKVYIIDEVHMLTAQAFNAFLKTLEEPPSYAIFILATTEKHKILPTILSRCQIFDFKRINTQDTVEHLQEITGKENIRAEKAALQIIAQKSEGCMRDALSILDKIVSFTNSELTYTNTLEHLNILDADYYFKLIDAMLDQDVGEALMLYDDINRKGFEGDMVLNGLAEFIRNLLVCRDPKVAGLLEVVESFKERYIATAAKLSPSWMISALNILNDAEISYKGARNKKLHVELVLIKLAYLDQAVILASGDNGVSKKKLADTKPVAFRQLQPIAVSKKKQTAASEMPGVETAVPSASMAAEATMPYNATPPPPAAHKPADKPRPETKQPAVTLGALRSIREQVAREKQQTENTPLPLADEPLQQSWNRYIDKLNEQKNHSAVTNFKLAKLRIFDEKTFEIVVDNNIQMKFIEQERAALVDHLQLFFNNRTLGYVLRVEESERPQDTGEPTLSSRQLYMKLSEEYPLIRELRDRLKMELDY